MNDPARAAAARLCGWGSWGWEAESDLPGALFVSVEGSAVFVGVVVVAGTQRGEAVQVGGPSSRIHSSRWWASHHDGGRSHPGHTQPPSRRTDPVAAATHNDRPPAKTSQK